MKHQILQLINDKPKHFAKIIRNNPVLMQWVEANASITTSNMSEMIYNALHGSSNKCEYGNQKKFGSIHEGYRFCGHASKCICAANSVSEKLTVVKNSYSEADKQKITALRKRTTLEKYGVENNAQTSYAKQRHQEYYSGKKRKVNAPKLTTYQRLNKKYQSLSNVEFVTTENDYIGVSDQTYYKFKCLSCNSIFDDYIDNGHVPKCKVCHPYTPVYTSKQETEVFEYVKTLLPGISVQQSNKSIINPYELDIVVPELKVAIEYCGLYWHSEMCKTDKNYHSTKLKLCNEKGYRLVTIFEDEWVQKPDVVKSRLRSILGKDDRIYARQCKVSSISSADARKFIEKHHIQGHAVSKIAYGCFHKDVLVAVMTFGKPRYDKNADYELIRYCSAGTVVGGAGKLFSLFREEYSPASVISYCDMRWGTGNLYKQLNFEETGSNKKPGYCYTDFVNRYHRSSFTKKNVAEASNSDQTEYQIMRKRNMYRIWDCGQTKWRWDARN